MTDAAGTAIIPTAASRIAFDGRDMSGAFALNITGDQAFAANDLFQMKVNLGGAAQTINAGLGTDTLSLYGFSTANTDFVTATVAGNVTTLTASNAAAIATQVYNLTAVEAMNFLRADGTAATLTASTFTGGAGADLFFGSQLADTMTGNGGADIFAFSTGNTGITLATADTITDFTTAADQIKTGFAGATAATIANGGGFAAGADAGLAAFITAADAVLTAGLGANDDIYAAYNVAATGNAYVVVDHNDSGSVDAGDSLIVLTGIDLVGEIALADFIV
jgi:hypothetical protein